MMRAASGLRRRLRHHDARTVGWWSIGHLAVRLAGPALRLRARPGIADLAAIYDRLDTTADDVLATLWPADASRSADLRAEFADVSHTIAERYSADLPFRADWAVETETAFLLYAVVRVRRPAIVVESGVANGHSTSVLLAALHTNGHGSLHSYDIRTDVGALVPDEYRERWRLVVGDPHEPETAFLDLLGDVGGAIDMFFHDADHSYLGQLFEFENVWPRLSDGGVLVSDDVDLSYAFADFRRRVDAVGAVLLDGRKAIGLLRR